MLAIVTGTISPAKGMSQLVLKDEKERLEQYKSSLQLLLCSGAFEKVIFCDNSNFEMEQISFLKEIARNNDVELELMSFQGDTQKVCMQGKGYGEGEIMNYVFSRSKLLYAEDYFVKLTGRLVVDNIKNIVKHMNPKNTYFNIPNRTIRNLYDTRIYGMPVRQYKLFFMDAYERVMDRQGIFLENVYTQILKQYKIKVYNFPRYPRIIGVSGSGGNVYGYTEWKCKIKDVLSCFNFYKIK